MIYTQKPKWVCKYRDSHEKCYRRVRMPNKEACTIVLDGKAYGICKYLTKRVNRKLMVSKYKPLPIGQVVYTLECLKERKMAMKPIDIQTIDEFIGWIKKRFPRLRMRKAASISCDNE
jgi:hypothetical protein